MTSDVPVHLAADVSHGPAPAGLVDERAMAVSERSGDLFYGRCAGLRRAVVQVAAAGLISADPGAATRRVVSYDRATDTVQVGSREYRLNGASRVWVLGAGKASYGVAAALDEILGHRIGGGLVAVRDPGLPPLERMSVVCSDHPLPSARSAEAAQRILAIAEAAGPGDLVLTCFTGGSSALASLPPDLVPLADKRLLHQQLLSSGMPITHVNAVRKAVSVVKGGRVALAAAPATVVNLTVSDVAGSPLDAVTDPTVQDGDTAAGARALLAAHGLWETVPSSVRDHLERDLPTPVVIHEPQTVMLADGASTVSAMAVAAEALGYRAQVVAEELEGDAEDIGPRLARQLLDALASEPGRGVMLLGCGGESVVTVTGAGSFSQGGPNQHAALAAAPVLAGHRAVALFIDTDGSDGGTELAGGLVDGATCDTADLLGVDIGAGLASRRSSDVCRRLRAGVTTGHTGTNVNDLFVLAGEPGMLP